MDTPELTLDQAPRLYLAPWHRARPHLAANALLQAQAAAPQLAGLAQRWLPRMPRRPLASQNIRAICRDPSSSPLLLDDAITCPWVALNTPEAINALAVDVDHDDALELREDLVAMGSAVVPDIMIDPWSGRAHVVQWLADPVTTTEAAAPKPIKAADYALRLLAAAMRGTPMPQRGLVKSPWGRVSALTGERLRRGARPSVPARWEAYEASLAAGSDLMWITIPGTGPTDLRTIIGSLAPHWEFDAEPSKPKVRLRKNRGLPDGRGRNTELFDLVRWWAYDTGTTSTEAILAEAARINGSGIFATPLLSSEIRATAKSIGRFMRERYRPRHGADTSRGRDASDGAGLDKQAKQSLAGRKSSAAYASRMDAAIAEGLAKLQAAGTPITQSALAAASGISERTVKRRWHVTQKVPTAALSDGAAALAAPGPQGRSSPRPLSPSSSFAEKAQADRQIRRTVASLTESTAANRRTGAAPVRVPEVSADVARDPTVQKALTEARQAHADSLRRSEQRDTRKRVQGRVAEFRRMAEAPDGWDQFRAHLDTLDQEFDHRESLATRFEIGRIRAQREAIFAGRWRQWRAAMNAVGRHERVEDLIPGDWA